MSSLFSGPVLFLLVFGGGVSIVGLVLLVRAMTSNRPQSPQSSDGYGGTYIPTDTGSTHGSQPGGTQSHGSLGHHSGHSNSTHHHDHGVSFGHSDSSSGGFDSGGGGGGGDGGGGGGGGGD